MNTLFVLESQVITVQDVGVMSTISMSLSAV